MKKNIVLEYAGLLIGCTILSLGLSLFLIPHTIAPGGLSGLAIVLGKLTGIKVSTFLFSISAPLLLCSIKILGKRDALKTFIGLIVATVTLRLVEPLAALSPTDNILIASIVGAIVAGVGLGIIFKVDASTGGTDLIALMLNRVFPRVPVSRWLSLVDGSIVVFAGIANKNFETSVYSAITLYILVKAIDVVIADTNYARLLFIVTDKEEAIREKILDTGVTVLEAKEGYKNAMLVAVNSKNQEAKLKKLAKEVDDKSLVIVAKAEEILGEGFGSKE